MAYQSYEEWRDEFLVRLEFNLWLLSLDDTNDSTPEGAD